MKDGTGTAISPSQLSILNVYPESSHEFVLLLQYLNGTLPIRTLIEADELALHKLRNILRLYPDEDILFPER